MPTSKILVTRRLSDEVMKTLEASGVEIVVSPEDGAADREWILRNAPGSTGILCMLTDKMDAEVFDAAGTSLRVLSTMSVGYDHIDRKAASSRGILVGYTPDVLTDAVADLTVMLALMAMRRGKEAMLAVHDSKWPTLGWGPYTLAGPSLSSNTTVGFLGFGRISQCVLSRLLPFGPKRVLYHTPSKRDDVMLSKQYGITVKAVGLEELAEQSDIVFVLCKGGPETKGLVGKTFLNKMRKSSVLVNTARGSIVDSDALAQVLREGKLFGAGLDVVDGEPNVDANHPLVREPRCVVLPHIGSATIETRSAMAMLAVENVVRGVKGEPLRVELKSGI